jgi:hypothetical membrane protein
VTRRFVDLRRFGAVAGFLGAAFVYLGGETAAAAAWRAPPYSYARNFVSDLGAPVVGAFHGRMLDSPLHALMNAAFVADGLLFLAGALLLAAPGRGPAGRAFLLFAAAHSAGMLLIGLVPETVPAPLGGLHLAGAVLAIGGGNAAILLGAKAARPPVPGWLKAAGVGLGAAGLAGFALLILADALFPGAIATAGAGLIERMSVYPITVWELLAGLALAVGRSCGA